MLGFGTLPNAGAAQHMLEAAKLTVHRAGCLPALFDSLRSFRHAQGLCCAITKIEVLTTITA